MQPSENKGLKHGMLFKCSQKLKLWATAWFVLGTQELTYYKSVVSEPKIIDLKQVVSIVAADVEDAKRAHSFKLSSPSFPRTLILAAATSEQADEWIAAIRTVASLYGPPPESPNGPQKLTPDQKNILQYTTEIVQNTGTLISAAAAASSIVPAVYNKLLLDNLSSASLLCATTGRVVVYKPKIQTGAQRFNSSVVDLQALLVKYKHTFQAARSKADAKGKETDPLAPAVTALDTLIAIVERTITSWLPTQLDPDLTKPLSEFTPEKEEEEEEKVDGSLSPYVSPFFVNPAASPPPCKKHWDLLIGECAEMIAYMETLGKDESSLFKLPPPTTMEQAKAFLTMSKRLHDSPPTNPSTENLTSIPEEQFSLMKQQILGSASSIDYHTASIVMICDENVPPQLIDVISHTFGISSALAKIPRAVRKHRTNTLVSAVENIGSFSFSLSKLIIQMVNHESFLRDPARGKFTLRDEVHAIQYIAMYMLSQCVAVVEGNYQPADILAFIDNAKLLALSVTNTLESVRHQLTPAKRKRASPRKLASELTDAATGSMVFWFGLVGQEASVHLAA